MLFRLSRFLLKVFLNICFDFKVFGKENLPKPPYLIVSNHVSVLDPPIVGAACEKYPIDFMAKQELFDMPVVGLWTSNVRCIPVDRNKKSPASLKEALKRIKKGHVVGIFPEGTRSTNGELQEAKRGIGFLAKQARVPVIPVYVDGSLNAFPKGGKIRFGSAINVYIGKPIYPEEFSKKTSSGKQDYDMVVELIMERIADLRKANAKN